MRASNVFLEEYRKKYQESLDSSDADAALTYDAGNFLLTALSKAETTNPEELMQTIRRLDLNGVTGKISLAERSEPKKTINILTIKKGKILAPGVAE